MFLNDPVPRPQFTGRPAPETPDLKWVKILVSQNLELETRDSRFNLLVFLDSRNANVTAGNNMYTSLPGLGKKGI